MTVIKTVKAVYDKSNQLYGTDCEQAVCNLFILKVWIADIHNHFLYIIITGSL